MTDEPQGTEAAQANGLRFSESVENIAPAFLQVQKQVEDPPRSGENPHFGSAYVTLEDLIHTVRPVLTANGISLHQAPGMEGGEVTVETLFLHESGEWARCVARSPMQRDDPQGVGSAITYLRRYSLASMLGLVHEADDDANYATQPREKKRGDGTGPEPGEWEDDPASEKQVGAIKGMVKGRDLTEDQESRIKEKLENGLTKGEASKAIDWLKRQPKANGGAPSEESEAEGASSDVPGEPAAKAEVRKRLKQEYGEAWKGQLSEFGFQMDGLSANTDEWTEAMWSEVLEGLERHGMAYIQAPDEVLSGEGAS